MHEKIRWQDHRIKNFVNAGTTDHPFVRIRC
jgi:hypothetical protein